MKNYNQRKKDKLFTLEHLSGDTKHYGGSLYSRDEDHNCGNHADINFKKGDGE